MTKLVPFQQPVPFSKFNSNFEISKSHWNQEGMLNKIKAIAISILEALRNFAVFIPNLLISLVNRLSYSKPHVLIDDKNKLNTNTLKSSQSVNQISPNIETNNFIIIPEAPSPIGLQVDKIYTFIKKHSYVCLASVAGAAALGFYGSSAIALAVGSALQYITSINRSPSTTPTPKPVKNPFSGIKDLLDVLRHYNGIPNESMPVLP